VKCDGPTPGLMMVGGVGAGSDPPIKRWGTVPEGARDQVGVGTAGEPAGSERLEVVHRQRGSTIWEDMEQTLLKVERWLWGERFTFDARTRGGKNVAVFFKVIFGLGAV
jgi:hypothetical protein